MSEQLYKTANPNGTQNAQQAAQDAGTAQGDSAEANDGKDGNVYDADYKVEEDEDKK